MSPIEYNIVHTERHTKLPCLSKIIPSGRVDMFIAIEPSVPAVVNITSRSGQFTTLLSL